jgi:hypothetical protein
MRLFGLLVFVIHVTHEPQQQQDGDKGQEGLRSVHGSILSRKIR